MIVDIYDYRISPYSGNTCWKIQVKQTKEDAKSEYREPNYFPTTMEQALDKVKELIALNDTKHVKSLNEAIEEYKKILSEFERVSKEFQIKYAQELDLIAKSNSD